MEKAFTRPYEEWQNLPLQTTPFTAEVMNNYDDSIEEIDNRVVDLSESNVELTKAEYDALPDAKLTNNVNYFIKDWDAEGGIAYSTEEQVVGTWIDGRKVYQKTYEFLNNPLNRYIYQPNGIDNLDYVIDFSAFFCNKGVSASMIPNSYMNVTVLKENIEISTTNTNNVTRDFYLTIKYVKTIN